MSFILQNPFLVLDFPLHYAYVLNVWSKFQACHEPLKIPVSPQIQAHQILSLKFPR